MIKTTKKAYIAWPLCVPRNVTWYVCHR